MFRQDSVTKDRSNGDKDVEEDDDDDNITLVKRSETRLKSRRQELY